MGEIKRKYYDELQKVCPHYKWSKWERGDDYHDARYCLKCHHVQFRIAC